MENAHSALLSNSHSGRSPTNHASAALRHVFAMEFPNAHGDNCLLTYHAALVDLPFSGLLAYQSRQRTPVSTPFLRRGSDRL